MTPKPLKTDFRNATRVDYFSTPGIASEFHAIKREEGYNASPPDGPIESGPYAGLYGVLWHDRVGEGFYA